MWDCGMVTGGPGQKSDLKKWPGLSDSDTVTGVLRFVCDYLTLEPKHTSFLQ